MERTISPVSDARQNQLNETKLGTGKNGEGIAVPNLDALHRPLLARGPMDRRSLFGALLGACLYVVLAGLSLSISSFDGTLASIWLPSAGTVAFLLKARLRNEIAFYLTTLPASVAISMMNGTAAETALLFSMANMINVALVTGLTRKSCGLSPDMSDLATLARFVWVGGLIGPMIAACMAGFAIIPATMHSLGSGVTPDWGTVREGVITWFLTDSMGMVLVVPTVLLLTEMVERRQRPSTAKIIECAALMASSAMCTLLVFTQSAYPLLFLIPPLTLLHAFRLGSIGTALHITVVSIIAFAMTSTGYGPIFEAGGAASMRLQLVQAFIAANFLTGLPVAAVLAGRERLTHELREGRRELRLLTTNITDAVLQIDGSGVCTYASPAVRDVLGRDPLELVGEDMIRNKEADADERIADALRKLLNGQSDKERLSFRRTHDDADGMPVFIEADCAISLDPKTGQRKGVVLSARDVTERVELELLLTRARRNAEDAASAKSDFLANMSHEIRTPMNGVLGFAELMLQGDLDEEQRRHTEMIVQSGRAMMLLLNDVLDLSKIEAGEIAIDTGPIDVHETLDECLALHRLTAREKGLSLRLEQVDAANGKAGGRSPTVIADGLRLRQIVLNLVGNAVKFTEAGEIVVRYSCEDNTLVIAVSDTGIGISEERREAIFRPFTQGENDIARRFGGTGLGLSISRQLAELLGGVIEVKSEPGRGSTFTLTLPTLEVILEPEPEVPPAPAVPQDLPHNARILLAEDHDVNRELVSEMLTRCGQSVAIAHDGNEAISMVIDSLMREAPYDLVLMDVQMPGCDGYAATRAIREEGIGPDTLPIIALTANAFPEDAAAARAAGMQAHLAKPINFADLAKALQRWLPTRIVEMPMDRDIALPSACPAEENPKQSSEVIPLPSTFDKSGRPADPFTSPPSKGELNGTPVNDDTSQPVPIATGALWQSASLLHRWLERRSEAIEAVRDALTDGALGPEGIKHDELRNQRDTLIGLMHKLAGTAATFGEAELGNQASQLERALRWSEDPQKVETIAFELLALADEPVDTPAQAGSSNS